jgi:hypothetical protein
VDLQAAQNTGRQPDPSRATEGNEVRIADKPGPDDATSVAASLDGMITVLMGAQTQRAKIRATMEKISTILKSALSQRTRDAGQCNEVWSVTPTHPGGASASQPARVAW